MTGPPGTGQISEVSGTRHSTAVIEERRNSVGGRSRLPIEPLPIRRWLRTSAGKRQGRAVSGQGLDRVQRTLGDIRRGRCQPVHRVVAEIPVAHHRDHNSLNEAVEVRGFPDSESPDLRHSPTDLPQGFVSIAQLPVTSFAR